MCGIAGIVHRDRERPVAPGLLATLAGALRHRGPDGEGTWSAPGVGLAHRRLAVLDLSVDGDQPMANEDGSVRVVFNGEIYNFQELRAELMARGHAFRSRTDTETIVHLYEEMGPEGVSRLEGMFAFALWDARRRRLVLARDRLGKKPLKYAEVGGSLLFASELKALLATGLVPADPDPDDVDDFLSLGYVPAPGTGLAAIRKLPPAHVLVWEDGQVRTSRYWTLDLRRKERRTAAEWREEVRREVGAAVRRRLVADVPLGAFLSGGIDSSIVVSCMAEAGGTVRTFSIGFEEAAQDERPHARRVAERYGTDHREFLVRADAVEAAPALAALYEEPYADSSALPSWLLARETRRHVTVALNGDGGDEGFGGYNRYARFLDREGARRGASGLRGLAASALRASGWLPPRLVRRAEGITHLADPDPGIRYGWTVRLFSDAEKARLRRGPVRPTLRLLSRAMAAPEAGTDLRDRMMYADVTTYLPGDLLPKMDLATMAHGLEARSPLLDHRVLELAASVPPEVRMPRGSLKRLLKEAFADRLPPDLMSRTKQGFAIPVDAWFRGPLVPMVEDLVLSPGARVGAWLRPAAVRALAREHRDGREDRGRHLWALLMLELWHRSVLEKAPVRAAAAAS